MAKKTSSILQIIIAGFLSFLATLSATQLLLFILWLIGDPEPTYQLITGIISGLFGLFVGGWITTRVMKSKDVWFSAFNGYLVGGMSALSLLGVKPITLAVSVLSFVFAGLGGYVALGKEEPAEPEPAHSD